MKKFRWPWISKSTYEALEEKLAFVIKDYERKLAIDPMRIFMEPDVNLNVRAVFEVIIARSIFEDPKKIERLLKIYRDQLPDRLRAYIDENRAKI